VKDCPYSMMDRFFRLKTIEKAAKQPAAERDEPLSSDSRKQWNGEAGNGNKDKAPNEEQNIQSRHKQHKRRNEARNEKLK
jgi:hypothetical protein